MIHTGYSYAKVDAGAFRIMNRKLSKLRTKKSATTSHRRSFDNFIEPQPRPYGEIIFEIQLLFY